MITNRFKAEVVVIGGGTAGVMAAVSSARSGAHTLLVEMGGHLGGLASIGMTWGGFFDNNHRRVVGGLPNEMVEEAVKFGGRGYFHYYGDGDKWISALTSIDPEASRFVFEKKLYDAGCQIMLFSTLCDVNIKDNKIEYVELASRLGKVFIEAKVFIDTTGDMSLATMAGAQWDHGRDGFTQCVSNMFRINGVNMDAYEEYLQEKINIEGLDPWEKNTGAIRRGIEYWCPWKFDGFEKMPKSLGIYYHGVDNDVILNCTAISANPLDIMELSHASYNLRCEAFKVHSYLKEKLEAFKNSYISQVYDIGVRESRRLIGNYTLNLDDIINHTKFADRIGMGAYPPDVHNPDGQVHISRTDELDTSSDGAYDIPLSSMTCGVKNMLVAGRCISSTFEAQSAIRGIGPCMVEGQGVGTAAAMMVKSDIVDVQDIDVSALQKMLVKVGVILD